MPPAAFLFCTWFGLGRLPKAPGTWGSLGALPFAWVLQSYGGMLTLGLALIALCLASIPAMETYLRHQPGDDPGAIVVDEVAGQWLTLLLVPPDPLLYCLGFVLFRAFDIVKPWPISWADRKVGGALGILLDDLLAGAYGCVLMMTVMHLVGR